ncbi:hypothetical protein C9J20_09095 [Photobacterium phosphoreum]|nr:hypothetical protein [Photobacterium phosphoreum]PSU66822.1 hypothetical protein CTM79_18425 [Photobacterium phosphoreum]PSW13043.1 hypothetical protein C9J20_09095 [Photobacterium phosphoreum]
MVHYDGNGERITQHQMDGAQVSQSIMALVTLYNESFKEANKIYRTNITSQVYVEGGMEPGSIKWLMRLIANDTGSQIQLEENTPLKKRVLHSISKTIELIRNMDLSTTELVIHENSTGYSIIIDNELVDIDEMQCAILTNDKIRGALASLAAPLDGNELDTLTISSLDTTVSDFRITAEDRHKFIQRRKHTKIIADGEFSGFYFIDTLSYSPNSKWLLINKDNPKDSINGLIVDTIFLARVSENKETFSKDDLLEVSGKWYKEKTKLTGKSKTTYLITDVRQHISAGDNQWELISQ